MVQYRPFCQLHKLHRNPNGLQKLPMSNLQQKHVKFTINRFWLFFFLLFYGQYRINTKQNNLFFLFCFYFQSKLSIFRGIILCLCLNLTYANVVRFPRELDRHGIEFLIPYLLILFLIGLPIVLLEIALGQFLGQGSAHSWRASPIFRGEYIFEADNF